MDDKYADIHVLNKLVHLAKVKEYIDSLYTKPVLKQLFIEMTLNCNEHCRHCGSRCGDLRMQDQLTDEEILTDTIKKVKLDIYKKIIDKIDSSRDLITIYDYCRREVEKINEESK